MVQEIFKKTLKKELQRLVESVEYASLRNDGL